MQKIITIACTLVIVLASLTTVVHALIGPGTPAPNFTLKDIHGNSYTLSAQTGKVVMIEYFFTT
jgi:hypothetical protein